MTKKSTQKNDPTAIKLEARSVFVNYGNTKVLHDVSIKIPEKTVTALIGPSGCGKSTFLRLFNRMNDYIDNFDRQGGIFINGNDIYHQNNKLEELRKTVGMVFQKPNPFPKSIYDNVAYGLKIHGIKKKSVLDDAVERALRQAALFDEVKDDLKKNALRLSGGQQQRLCIARALAVEPSVILMDEPASALDPISTAKVEHLISELKKDYTIVIVTHNLQQAQRVSDQTAFLYFGKLVEYSNTKDLFNNPREEETQKYVGGHFG